MPDVHEIQCKTLLNKSGIPGIDYSVNPYTGCLHACSYCYAGFMARYTAHGMAWGTFCDPKINAAGVLEKEIRKRPPGLVSLSTVTDPYQAAESKYGLTRAILGRLADSDFTVSILTKSGLVLRDCDILKRFGKNRIEVGFSINTADETVRMAFEPGAPPVSDRLDALRLLHNAGIATWVFIAPVLPGLTLRSLEVLLPILEKHADRVLIDGLNIKAGNWNGIVTAAGRLDPAAAAAWNNPSFVERERRKEMDLIAGTLAERLGRKTVSRV
ncbi:radical SAM protein [bacterium]|nr:radical SAM protein [bacterium]